MNWSPPSLEWVSSGLCFLSSILCIYIVQMSQVTVADNAIASTSLSSKKVRPTAQGEHKKSDVLHTTAQVLFSHLRFTPIIGLIPHGSVSPLYMPALPRTVRRRGTRRPSTG
jgi:hypothetical protein